ncbi:MAG TPA: ATP-dependent protease LonB [Candidatus Woesearchaeota archaeon]|nr:ATP-dependent protease LonB [Candidatus Woesearchaeota archaeon]
MKTSNFKTTDEIKVPEKLVDQVIGQEKAVEVIKKAAGQRRHVLLIGEPGTGKSLIGLALAQLLPKEILKDVLASPNPKDENNPKIVEVPAGKGRGIIDQARMKAMTALGGGNPWVYLIAIFLIMFTGMTVLDWIITKETSDILKAADRIAGTMFLVVMFFGAFIFYATYKMKFMRQKISVPKIIIDNSSSETAPFVDATGLHEGALLGDVQHDPFMSGGLGTPPHERVIAGALHKANKGVLFIDEIATLKPEMQVEILTAMQEKKYAITGRSERSAGAMVTTDPVPTDFILVAAGNLDTIKHMHPALRSRIRGSGYEVFMQEKMEDTKENAEKIYRFIAQEIAKDKKIPPFSKDAADAILQEARRRAGRKGFITLKLRDLGGLIRVAGDMAKEDNAKEVTIEHIKRGRTYAATLEQQITQKYTIEKKAYQIIQTKGTQHGRVNGLAVLGDADSGLVLPIEATVVPAMEKGRGRVIATGRLGEIAKEAISNVSAIFKKYAGKDISNFDVHIQFLQTYEGLEGDSASISVATAVISAITGVPVRQDVAMTGSLSIRGEVLPVGGINSKLEAAKEADIRTIIIPKSNGRDVLINKKGLEIIETEDIADVLEHALKWPKSKKHILNKIKKAIK